MPAGEQFRDTLASDSLDEASPPQPGMYCVVAVPPWPDLDTDVGQLVEVIDVASNGGVWTAPYPRTAGPGRKTSMWAMMRNLISPRRLRPATIAEVEAAAQRPAARRASRPATGA